MRLIAAVSQRLQDVMREVRIRALAASAVAEHRAGRTALAREALDAMGAEIEQRSAEQVARMERAGGLRQ